MKEDDNVIADLSHSEAIEKIREIVDHTNICMFTTHLDKTPLPTRPMATQKVDDEGSIWFLSDSESEKNLEIENDSRVQLIYANVSKSEYMTVYGHAIITKDRAKIEEMWTPMAKAWFKGGKDDPTLSIIQVIPDNAYYWDTRNSKMISFLKILVSVVSDKAYDDGVQGKLKV